MKLWELLWRSDLKEKFVIQKFLCHFLWCSREELWLDMDKELSDECIQKVLVAYKSYVEDKKPLEFILGHVDFFCREFFVNEATLIPRPETEYMITATTEYIQSQENSSKNNLLLDIGTGCGVLWISVLLQNPDYFSEVIFSDYFENALDVAKKNYETYKGEILAANSDLKVEFFQSDLLKFLNDGTIERLNDKSSTLKGTSSFAPKGISFGQIKEDSNIVLVANLPYIPEEMFEANAADNVKKFEPKPAFVGGADWLDYYRTMFDQLLDIRHKYQDIRQKQESLTTWYLIPITMFLEMMTWQVDILRQEFGDRMEFEEVKTFHFNIRIVKSWLK